MNTITLTDEQMKALQSGQPITIEPPKQSITTKWEPKGGKYIITPSLSISVGTSCTHSMLSGLAYQTKEQAMQAAKALRSYARQLRWFYEHDDGWIADWNDTSKPKSSIAFDEPRNRYSVKRDYDFNNINNIYMSEENAEKLCRLLNEGVVEF